MTKTAVRTRSGWGSGWSRVPTAGLRASLSALLCSLVLTASSAATNPPPVITETAPPETPREFYNAGAQKLLAGKLREAEAFLESALASQDERLQPPALYNLGHVRFAQGVEELKKGPPAGPAKTRGRTAGQMADNAIRSANDALASNDVQQMVVAYLRGRGVRKELKAATTAVRKALEAHGAALLKWQRASGDFHGAAELQPNDTDARQNAEVVDRCIAKLVDSLRELQQMAAALGDKDRELGDKMKMLKGRIPAPDAPPGGGGDDEQEEEQPQGPLPGEKEGPTRDGQEMTLSQEQAGWLLEGFKLDAERRLPMGQGEQGQPRERTGRTW